MSASALCGIGWRAAHAAALFELRPALPFLEVHSENFFGEGGPALATLHRARADWDISLHGVGLGLGSAAGLDPWHLDRLAALVRQIEPLRVSDHASFARVGSPGGPLHHACDLLPVAFSRATLARMVDQVQQVQERLGRPLLVEHLATCLRWREAEFSEPDFFNELARRSGCQLLLDLNNLLVNALNEGPGTDPLQACRAWVDALSPGIVGEIHLAGHDASGPLVIDDHGAPVPEGVWQLLRHTLGRLGPVPLLLERDTDLPPLPSLLAEAAQADAIALELDHAAA